MRKQLECVQRDDSRRGVGGAVLSALAMGSVDVGRSVAESVKVAYLSEQTMKPRGWEGRVSVFL